MKKNKLNVLLTGLLSLAMVGCSSETTDILGDGTDNTGNVRTITIQLPNINTEAVSYAAASTAENKLNDLTLYVINGSIIEDIVPVTPTASNTATVQITGSGARELYLAGNTTATNLSGMVKGSSSVTDLLGTRSTALTVSQRISTTPNGLLMDGYAYVADIATQEATGQPVKVTMKRRVARFDVVNYKADTKFELNSVLINKAKSQAKVFTTTSELTSPNIKMNEFTIDNSVIDSIPAAFYLNPTTYGTGGSQTEISFTDKNGTVYSLDLTNGKKIEANKRYIIRFTKSADGTIGVDVDTNTEWDNDSTTASVVTSAMSNITLTTANGATGEGAKSLDMTASTGSATFTFTTSSSTNSRVMIGTTDAVRISVTSTDPVLSYAAAYMQTHTVTVNEALNGDHEITVSDKSGPIGTIEIKAGNRFVNPLKGFAKANLTANRTIPATALESTTAGLVSNYGGWFQWGRKTGFANPSSGDPVTPIAEENFDTKYMTETDGAFYGGNGMTTWHELTGGTSDTWTHLVSQGAGVVDSDPCMAVTGAVQYRIPTADEWLAVLPATSAAGNYTSGNAAISSPERTGIQITSGATGDVVYRGAGSNGQTGANQVKTLYGAKKLGTDQAYALRWRYVGTGVAFTDQTQETGGDTYLEITCIPLNSTSFTGDDVAAFEGLNWTTNAEVRFFPAAGRRFYSSGAPQLRGVEGYYWASSASSAINGWRLYFGSSNTHINTPSRTEGFAVRCIAL